MYTHTTTWLTLLLLLHFYIFSLLLVDIYRDLLFSFLSFKEEPTAAVSLVLLHASIVHRDETKAIFTSVITVAYGLFVFLRRWQEEEGAYISPLCLLKVL